MLYWAKTNSQSQSQSQSQVLSDQQVKIKQTNETKQTIFFVGGEKKGTKSKHTIFKSHQQSCPMRCISITTPNVNDVSGFYYSLMMAKQNYFYSRNAKYFRWLFGCSRSTSAVSSFNVYFSLMHKIEEIICTTHENHNKPEIDQQSVKPKS